MPWPITWPDQQAAAALDPNIKALAELYADRCMRALTLHRVGTEPVTIMPVPRHRVPGYWALWEAVEDAYPLGWFYPGTAYPSLDDLQTYLRVDRTTALELPGPVGAITEVRVDAEVLPATSYRLENGRYLVRTDGGVWPSTSGDGFTITYLNAYPVDALGAHAGGVMAEEWVKVLTRAKNGCRLPKSITNISRQGITMEIAPGMFPGGVTGIPEIDAYLMIYNPHGLKVSPQVFSPDLPVHRQVR